MPIISEAQAESQTPILAPQVTPTPVQAPPAPGALDTAAAAFRQSNIISSLYDRQANGGSDPHPAVPGYDPFVGDGAEVRGYEDYAHRFVNSESPAETQAIKNQISSELSDKQTLARAGVPGYIASMAAGTIDPITLTSMLIPGGGEARLARIGVMVATNVAAGEAQSAALAATQQTGGYSEGIIPRIGANALLAGVLGSIASRVPRAELNALAERTKANLEAPEGSTAGAAAVRATTLEEESVAKGGRAIAKTVGQISPVTRLMTNSEVVEARQLAQQLVDPGVMLEKNIRGVATPSSVEMRVNQVENVRNSQVFQKLDNEFSAYKQGGGEMSKGQFSAAVADAMRNGDAHDVKEVANVASFTRPMFSNDRQVLSELGLMGEGTDVVGAPSYFPRVYDQHMVMNHQTDLERRLTAWYTEHPKTVEPKKPIKGEEDIEAPPPEPIYREPTEVKSAVRDTINHILGTVRGTADIGQGVKNPSIMKGRVLDVPDSILAPYLSHDFEHAVAAYNRAALPQIEMHRTFGSADLADQFQKIDDAYKIKLNYATDDAAKAKLTKQQAADMYDLGLIRDRVLNTTGPRGNDALNVVRAAQLVRGFNYLRMLGGQTLSAIPDLGRLVTRYGLANTGIRLAQFLSGLTGGLSRADAQRMGTALDTVLHTRAHTLEGIGDEMAGSTLGAGMRNATARFTKITGVASWDAMMRLLSSQLEQDAIFRAVTKDKISTFERAKLAAHGIGDAELPAVREQWLKHGSDENGLNRARTELWTNKTAADAVENAVQRAASSTAFFVGKGDLPGFANNQLGKMLIQFKAFAISSVNRMTIPLAQGLAHRDIMAANGMLSLLALGAFAQRMKDLANGYQPDTEPGSIIANAVQRSGLLTYVPDLYDPVAGSVHLPRFSKFQDLNPLETALGPSVGTGTALLDTIRRMTKGDLAAADMHKFRQLLPYQNLFYLTRIINAAEGKVSDAVDAKNAPRKDLQDYINPAMDEPSKAKADKTHLFGQEQIPNAF